MATRLSRNPAPAICGETSKTRPHSAIRNGDWKLIYFHEDDRAGLHHPGKDLAEQNDLAVAEPDRTATTLRTLLGYLEKVDARLPEPNPDFRR